MRTTALTKPLRVGGEIFPAVGIFVGAGGDEVLLDPIKQTAENIRVEVLLSPAYYMHDLTMDLSKLNTSTIISVVPREFHIEPITDVALKVAPPWFGVQGNGIMAEPNFLQVNK